MTRPTGSHDHKVQGLGTMRPSNWKDPTLDLQQADSKERFNSQHQFSGKGFKMNADSAPFVPSNQSSANHTFREFWDRETQKWIYARVQRKDHFHSYYTLQLLKTNRQRLPRIRVPFHCTQELGTHLHGDPEAIYNEYMRRFSTVLQPYSAVNIPLPSDQNNTEPDLDAGCSIVEVRNPENHRWTFGKIISKDASGYRVQLLKKGVKSLPEIWVPNKNVQKVGTYFKGSDAGHMERTFFTRLTCRRNTDEPVTLGLRLGAHGEWFEYLCGQCKDVFPSERSLQGRTIRCPACRKANHYGGYGVKQRPINGWFEYDCCICNRRYPSAVAYRGTKPRCLTCRDDHKESYYADSPCSNCGVAHGSSTCKSDVGGPAYLDLIRTRHLFSRKNQ